MIEADAETIKEIERLATGHRQVEFMKRPGDPGHIVHLINHAKGTAEMQKIEPPLAAYKLGNPNAFFDWIKHPDTGDGTVFYNETALVWEEKDRLSRATCKLPKAPQYVLLENTKALDQVAFIRQLRIDLRGCLPDESNLITLVRELKFGASVDATGSIQHQRESLGKSVLAQVSGASSIPEEILVNIPIFENLAYRTFVPCAIEIFPADQKFKLTPFPLALREAMDRAIGEIAKMLSGDGMPAAYYGEP